jgi:hypothetical protein
MPSANHDILRAHQGAFAVVSTTPPTATPAPSSAASEASDNTILLQGHHPGDTQHTAENSPPVRPTAASTDDLRDPTPHSPPQRCRKQAGEHEYDSIWGGAHCFAPADRRITLRPPRGAGADGAESLPYRSAKPEQSYQAKQGRGRRSALLAAACATDPITRPGLRPLGPR